MKPEMIVIAGPSGSGKSRHFGAQTFGIAFFNVDDQCAEETEETEETIARESAGGGS